MDESFQMLGKLQRLKQPLIIFIKSSILFFGRNLTTVLEVWSLSVAFFFANLEISFWIDPGVVKILDSVCTEILSDLMHSVTSETFGPCNVRNCLSRELAIISVISSTE